MTIFQGFNQLIVLATLLSIGLGGLATPIRRESPEVIIRNGDRGLCADVDNLLPLEPVEFFSCEEDLDFDTDLPRNQAWVLNPGVQLGSKRMTPLFDDRLCAGVAEDFSVKLLFCDEADPNDIDLFFDSNLDNPGINFGARGVCMSIDEAEQAIVIACDPASNDQDIRTAEVPDQSPFEV